MTDLEMTKLCAEAMGYTTQESVWDSRNPNSPICVLAHDGITGQQYYDPLIQDTQAMALVKKFRLALSWDEMWCADGSCHHDDNSDVIFADDLNRAIVEVVANMAAKRELRSATK